MTSRRKSRFTYNTEELTKNINAEIERLKTECDVIYISHLIQNIVTNRLLFGFSIEGTPGAELYDGLHIVSDLIFDKYTSDAFKSKRFRQYISDNNYDEILLCGLDQCGCVYHTAIGALKAGKKVSIIKNATACRFSEKKRVKAVKGLKELGVHFV